MRLIEERDKSLVVAGCGQDPSECGLVLEESGCVFCSDYPPRSVGAGVKRLFRAESVPCGKTFAYVELDSGTCLSANLLCGNSI